MCAQKRNQPPHTSTKAGVDGDSNNGRYFSASSETDELENKALLSRLEENLSHVIRRMSDDGGDVFETARSQSLKSTTEKSISPPLLKMADADTKQLVINERKGKIEENGDVLNSNIGDNDFTLGGHVTIDMQHDDQIENDQKLKKRHAADSINPTSLVKKLSPDAGKEKYFWLTSEELADYARREKHKKARRYYQKQLELVKNFQEDSEFIQKFTEDEAEVMREQERVSMSRSQDILAKLSLFANVCLLIAKAVAAGLSGSLVVVGSVVDSATDITAGLVIYLTNRAIIKRDTYEYPRGRTRLQPIALIIISVIMGACSVQVISKSVESLARGNMDPDVELPTIIIMISTIVIKFSLMVLCYLYRSPSTSILAQDHRNDTISNSIALVCAYLASKYASLIYLDPIAAILVSVYILITWLRTGNEHVKALSGRAAKPEFINRIVKICLDHKPALKQIDTVFAYHYGTKYLVEVDVVLDESLSLKEAHDIAEPLQRKIEHLHDVERAFVHIDYETEHRPEFEHKVV